MKFVKTFLMTVLLVTLLGFAPSFAQTVDLTISNQQVSGGYLYFDIVLERTSAWAADYLGDCSFYFSYNTSALSNPFVSSQHANLTSGNGYTITYGTNNPYVYVTINYGYSLTPMAIAQSTDYTLVTVRMDIDNPAASSNLDWNTTASAVLDVADQSTTESYYGGSDLTLPVELSSFTANHKGNTVSLTWTTESESNNLGFILKRKTANAEWKEIVSFRSNNELVGKGTTSSPSQYNYTDATILAGECYTYCLYDVSSNGEVTEIGSLFVETLISPKSTRLYAAYPNPFNPSTTLNYNLAQDSHVTMTVYDVLGRQIKLLNDKHQSAGEYSIKWDGSTDAGITAPSGTYLVRMQSNGYNNTQKILFLK